MNNGKSFKEGLLYNYISIAILALSGFFFYAIILLYFDIEILGIFNQVYAYFVLFSQICVFGMQAAMLKEVSLNYTDEKKTSQILFNGMIITSFISFVIALFLIVITSLSIKYFSWDLGCSILAIIPGLVFFAINKVILAYFNGLEKMKEYAIFQSLRYVLIAVAIYWIYLLEINPILIGLSFTFAEVFLFVAQMIYLIKKNSLIINVDKDLMKRMIAFGIKIIPSNLMLEFNTKIDILCLGWIIGNNRVIGMYSFAILFAEGFYQLYIVIRRSLNPSIAQIYEYRRPDFRSHFSVIKRYSGWLSVPSSLILLTGYVIVCIILGKNEYFKMLFPLMIIVFSISVNGFYIIMGNTLAQIGRPILESKVNSIACMTNLVMNFCLIIFWGIYGAALATGISYFAFSITLKYYMKKESLI